MSQQHPPTGPSGGVNVVIVRGVLSRSPERRELPSGDALVAYEVTVPRDGGPAESMPVVWIDPPHRLPAVTVGDAVVVVGRVRRRFFRAGGTTQSRTEVVAEKVVSGRHPGRSRRAVERALGAALDGLSR